LARSASAQARLLDARLKAGHDGRRRAALDAATSLDDLSPLKSLALHKLSGARKNQWAMTINGPWRVCFRFEDGDAWDVEIVDYH
jgi:proteic killer suppression protein